MEIRSYLLARSRCDGQGTEIDADRTDGVYLAGRLDKRSENYAEMLERGYLIRTEFGIRTAMDVEGETIHWDVTNPEARDYVSQKAKNDYFSYGI